MSRGEPFVITTRVEKWRFECPYGEEPGDGHDDWRLWDGVFSCETCKRNGAGGEDVQNVYDHLRDKRTGELVPREQIRVDVQEPGLAKGD